MKVIFRNSSLVFQKAVTPEHVALNNTGAYLSKSRGGTHSDPTQQQYAISDFISLSGVSSIVVENLKYGYQAAPYWYYTSNDESTAIADSCSVYNSQSEVISTIIELDGELNDKPVNANYIRFSSLGEINKVSISILRN